MRKIYISMPKRDKTEEGISLEQERLLMLAGEHLKEPVELVETFIAGYPHTPLECLVESLKRMSEADYVIFSECWENERCCRIEYAIARDYEKNILLEHCGRLQEVH